MAEQAVGSQAKRSVLLHGVEDAQDVQKEVDDVQVEVDGGQDVLLWRQLLHQQAVFVCSVESKYSPPKVQLYSRDPGENGKDNTLICHVSDFHPPDITIQLMKDGVELPNAKLTDLSFKQNWQFHLTKSVPFLPNDGQMYSCKVTHGSNVKDYAWGESGSADQHVIQPE
uniref:Beta-2-microglobulin n=1 Tax=Scophthalmus maximus TaxID=52904 RepID=A0A8D3D290_SCOMX